MILPLIMILTTVNIMTVMLSTIMEGRRVKMPEGHRFMIRK